jgi:hypothetical protein
MTAASHVDRTSKLIVPIGPISEQISSPWFENRPS